MKKGFTLFLFAMIMIALPMLSKAGAPATPPPTKVVMGGTYLVNGQYFKVRPFNLGVDPSTDGEFFPEKLAILTMLDPHKYDISSLHNTLWWVDLVQVPFDAGLSVLLGAGALTAFRKSRKKNKEVAIA